MIFHSFTLALQSNINIEQLKQSKKSMLKMGLSHKVLIQIQTSPELNSQCQQCFVSDLLLFKFTATYHYWLTCHQRQVCRGTAHHQTPQCLIVFLVKMIALNKNKLTQSHYRLEVSFHHRSDCQGTWEISMYISRKLCFHMSS